MIHRLGLTEDSPPADWQKALKTVATNVAPEHAPQVCLTLSRLFEAPLSEAEILGIAGK